MLLHLWAMLTVRNSKVKEANAVNAIKDSTIMPIRGFVSESIPCVRDLI